MLLPATGAVTFYYVYSEAIISTDNNSGVCRQQQWCLQATREAFAGNKSGVCRQQQWCLQATRALFVGNNSVFTGNKSGVCRQQERCLQATTVVFAGNSIGVYSKLVV